MTEAERREKTTGFFSGAGEGKRIEIFLIYCSIGSGRDKVVFAHRKNIKDIVEESAKSLFADKNTADFRWTEQRKEHGWYGDSVNGVGYQTLSIREKLLTSNYEMVIENELLDRLSRKKDKANRSDGRRGNQND